MQGIFNKKYKNQVIWIQQYQKSLMQTLYGKSDA